MKKYQKIELNKLLISALIKMYFKILIPSLVFSFVMVIVINFNIFSINEFSPAQKNNINTLSALIIAPIIETLIMSFAIKLLSEKINSEIKISFMIGLISSVIHGIQNFTSLLSAGWSFYMFSIFFIEIQKKTNYWTAYIFSFLLHFLINLTAIIFFKLVTKIPGA